MYPYNPNLHVKIWLSNNPNVFMNLENQVRLIEMREQNPKGTIHLVYDSSLLNSLSINELFSFCNENNIVPFDAHTISVQLKSRVEQKLYSFYRDEINHLNSGGNLGVASDILRWLSPIFKLGTYTDFDFPIDTSNFPRNFHVEAPILLNIGSLKLGKKEFILANNDFICIVNEEAAAKDIERVQKGILTRLEQYDNDFVEKTENDLNKDSFFNRYLLKFLKNRSESIYIIKSRKIVPPDISSSSLTLRRYIIEVMTDKKKFLDFNKLDPNETKKSVICRLRKELQEQLNFIKYLFFNKEYTTIKQILEQNDNRFLTKLMKKELELYLKSIVICTTGPIEISHALFDGYVVDIDKFVKDIQPLSFYHYGLHKYFQSQNSIPLHENVFGMLKFLGIDHGEVNDASWLDSGRKLQLTRTKDLILRKKKLSASLPRIISLLKNDIEKSIQRTKESPYRHFIKSRHAKKDALELILTCFSQENEFNIARFKEVLFTLEKNQKESFNKKIIKDLEQLCHDAVLFNLTKDKKIKLASTK